MSLVDGLSPKFAKFILGICGSKLRSKLPDELYLRLKYKATLKKVLHLEHPRTFNEKLQWIKLHLHKPEFTRMVDKVEAKKYVSSVIGEQYIIPTYGVWEKFDDIDFDSLPNQFVLKCTHDSGGLFIVKDKSKMDKEAARQKIVRSLNFRYFSTMREWPYKNVRPRILAEKYLETIGDNGIRDYKFLCWNGIPKVLSISEGMNNHGTAHMSFFDLDGNLIFNRKDYSPFDTIVTMPENLQDMIEIASKLANSIPSPFVRIDLYSFNGCILFSEITFFPSGGMLKFCDDKWDEKLGEWIDLNL